MKEYRFGIVGCGVISKFHALAIRDLPNAKIVACTDRVEDLANKFAAEHNCDAHTDVEEMVKREDLDIVTICTPSGAHMEPAVAAANAGKHVVVEKPIEITLERCDAIINACKANNVISAGIFPARFTAAPMAIKKAIEDGRFGRITVGDAYNKWFRSQEYYDGGGWRGTMKLDGGGAVMNQGVHAVDLIQWLMGPVETVFAFADCLARERIEVEDTCVAAIRYKNGALGTIECTSSVYPGSARRIEILGSKGTVVLENGNFLTWKFEEELPEDAEIREEFSPDKTKISGSRDPANVDHTPFREELSQVLAAIDSATPLPVDGLEARKAVELTLAMYKSAESGQAITLPL
jgi:UDP-N-acetyl-2-amino-2-deoxyglucuronate dehydrogenase